MQVSKEFPEAENWHTLTKEEIFRELKTSERGLTELEAKKRIETYGKNTIKKTHKFRPLKIFFSQFHSFLIYILIIAAAISFFIGHVIDASVISAIIILNAGIGFFQQFKAERAIINLKKLLVPKSKVFRGENVVEINSELLVPGDIVLIERGNSVNADLRIFESNALQTDESALTGESLPSNKSSGKLKKDISLAERENILFAGTKVVRGSAKAMVVSTGMHTSFGKIASDLQDIELQKTPMQKNLDNFSKQIAAVIISLIALLVLVGIFEKINSIEIFLTAVALAVSAIPEGLPAVLAISFAISASMMSKSNVIVRRLPAVESLGSVSIICSDKTGTITEEKMTIKEIFASDNFYIKKGSNLFRDNKEADLKINKHVYDLLKTGVLSSNARFQKVGDKYEFLGDPTENAILSASLDLGINKKDLTEKFPRINEIEFDSERKMMSIIRPSETKNKNIIYSKGAIESLLQKSKYELISGKVKKLTKERKVQILNFSKKMEEDALRVISFAYKEFSEKEKASENDLVFLGFVGMIDPPRKEIRAAVKQCLDAGIKIKMITGDSALTAKAIANQVGIIGKIVTEQDLIKMSDTALMNSIDEIAIFARTSPHQKLRITKILQEKNEVVAITGDGINDVLALKAADVGISMGIRGTDVARDVSDIVLIDDNFASIVQGIKEGRKTYDNIKKFTRYLLAVNFSEIFLILFSVLFKLPLPLLPLQILWINLVTDSFPALALVFEKQEDVMKSKPRREKSILQGVWKHLILAGIITFVVKTGIFLLTLNNYPIEKVRTMVLTTGILFELFFVYTMRTDKSLVKTGMFSNKWVNYAVLFSIALHLLLLYSPLGAVFGVVPLSIREWMFIVPFSVSGLVIFEIWKLVKKK